MKKTLIFFSLVSGLLFCTAVLAQVKDFSGGSMSVQAPESWRTEYNAKINQIRVGTPELDYLMSVQILDRPKENIQDFCTEVSNALGGTSPKKAGSNDNHYFFFAPFDKEKTSKKSSDLMIVNILMTDSKVMTIVEAGNGKPYRKETDLVWKSIQSSNPEEQAALEMIFKK